MSAKSCLFVLSTIKVTNRPGITMPSGLSKAALSSTVPVLRLILVSAKSSSPLSAKVELFGKRKVKSIGTSRGSLSEGA